MGAIDRAVERKKRREEEAARVAKSAAAVQTFERAASQKTGVRSDYYKDLQRQYTDLDSRMNSLNPSGFGNWVSGNNKRIQGTKSEMASQLSAIQSLLASSGAAFGALDAQQGPEFTPQMIARLRALDQESQASSLAEDPLFQGDRSTLVQGGQQALSGVANRRLGFGATGGFSNLGSSNDVFDRLGAQLSQLGQDSRKVKESKRDVVAQSFQAQSDAENAFENAQKKAEAAIISGNLEQAYRFMQEATQAEVAMREAQAQFQASMTGNLVKGALTGAAYAFGGPAGSAVAGGAVAGGAGTDSFMKAGLQKSMPPQIAPMDPGPFEATAPARTLKGRR